jgi:hypothetical protein
MLPRPRPPHRLVDASADAAIELVRSGRYFVPAPELIEWALETFIAEGATLENPDHAHLQHARLGALWTAVANSRNAAMAPMRPTSPRWSRPRPLRRRSLRRGSGARAGVAFHDAWHGPHFNAVRFLS